MKKLLIVSILATLIVPATSLGGPDGQDHENAARACRAIRALLGPEIFRQTYGTVKSKRRNAFGRCVSSKAKASSDEARQNTVNAARSCKDERAQLGAGPFREKYGRNASDRNAFGKCVSQLAKAKTA